MQSRLPSFVEMIGFLFTEILVMVHVRAVLTQSVCWIKVFLNFFGHGRFDGAACAGGELDNDAQQEHVFIFPSCASFNASRHIAALLR